MQDNRLVKVYKILLGAVVVTPLVMSTGGIYPFLVPKALFFRTLVSFSLALFSFLWARGVIIPRLTLLRNKITWIPAGLLLVSYSASIQGISFYHSFWSTFERMDGLLTLTTLIIFFYLLLLSFTKEDFKKFFTISVYVSGVVGILALLEWQHLIPAIESSNIDKPAGTIGNPAFVAGYMLIMMPLAYYFARIAQTSFQKYIFYVLSVFAFITIILTGTRGAVVALVAGAFFLLVWYLIYAKDKKIKQVGGGIFLFLIIFGGILYAMRDSDIVIVRRITNISLNDDTTRSRLFIWQNSMPYVLERPLLGYGLENFEYVYNKIYDPSVIDEEWFDRSHNVYVDLLVHTGIVGMATYFLLVGSLAYVLFILRKKDELLSSVLLFLLITYAIQNFFIFDTLNTSIFFYALCAYIFFLAREDSGGFHHIAETIAEVKDTLFAQSLSSQKQFALYGVSFLVIASLYWTTIQPIRANMQLSEGYTHQVVDVNRSLTAWKEGIALNTFADMEYGYQAYDAYFNRKGTGSITPEEQKKSYEFTVSLLEDLIRKYPWNARLYVYLAHVYDEPAAGVIVPVERFKNLLDEVIKLSPKRKQPYYILANISLRKMDTAKTQSEKEQFLEEGAKVLKLYMENAPRFAEPKIILANLYRGNGKTAEAKKYLEEGLATYTPSVSVARRIVGYLLAEKDYVRTEPYLKYISDESPADYDVLFDLAHIYFLNNKLDEARDAVIFIQQRAPQVLTRDEAFVKNLLKR